MASDENLGNNASSSSDPADDLEVFSEVVAAMKRLDGEARLRLFRTLATFFDLPSNDRGFRKTEASITQTKSDSTAPFSEDRSISSKQFLFEKKPNTDIERIACLAYYLTHYLQTPHFKTLDLSKLNTDAAQIKFSNPAQAVDNATRAGLLVQATKGQKQLSAIGELYVQALPDRVAAKEAIAHGRPRRGKGKAKSSDKDLA